MSFTYFKCETSDILGPIDKYTSPKKYLKMTHEITSMLYLSCFVLA